MTRLKVSFTSAETGFFRHFTTSTEKSLKINTIQL